MDVANIGVDSAAQAAAVVMVLTCEALDRGQRVLVVAPTQQAAEAVREKLPEYPDVGRDPALQTRAFNGRGLGLRCDRLVMFGEVPPRQRDNPMATGRWLCRVQPSGDAWRVRVNEED